MAKKKGMTDKDIKDMINDVVPAIQNLHKITKTVSRHIHKDTRKDISDYIKSLKSDEKKGVLPEARVFLGKIAEYANEEHALLVNKSAHGSIMFQQETEKAINILKARVNKWDTFNNKKEGVKEINNVPVVAPVEKSEKVPLNISNKKETGNRWEEDVMPDNYGIVIPPESMKKLRAVMEQDRQEEEQRQIQAAALRQKENEGK